MAELRKEKHPSISNLLNRLIKQHQNNQVLTYGELVKVISDQAYGLILVLFALPSALPISVIPGFSFIFSLPIVFVAIHIIIGRHSLWLPAGLSERPVEIKKLALVVKKTRPYLMTVERLLKPRLSFLFSTLMERVMGCVLLGLSLLLLLPIPFSNFSFAALIILFGLGLSEKDGLVVMFAYLGSILYGLFLTSLARELFRLI